MGENFQTVPLLERLQQIAEDTSTQDFQLVARDRTHVRVHKCLLAQYSSFLSTLLADHLDCDEMILDGFEVDTLACFKEMLYCGEILSPVDLAPLSELCRVFAVNTTQTVQEIRRRKVPPPPPESPEDTRLTVKLEENLTKSQARSRELEKRERKKKKKRVLTAELEPSDLTCQVCGKEFPVLYKLKIHSLIHSDTYPFSCGECGKGFNNKYKMKVHERKAHHASQAPEEAPEETNSDSEIGKPAPEPEGAGRVCEECSIEFPTKYAFQEHVVSRHPEFKTYLCSTCGKGLKSQKGLDHHVQVVCNKARKTFLCPVCQIQLASASELRKHQRGHGPKAQYRCSSCPTICTTKKGLQIHERSMHPGESEQNVLRFQCLQCGRAFLKASYLEDHIQRFHTEDKQFACILCPKKCATKQDLDRHLFSHRGEAIFQCNYCPKSFIHRANYRQHTRSHLGQRPYKCLPCNKGFGLLGVLRKHQKSHRRKGDHTQIITAPKGRRGHMSYIDYADAPSPQSELKPATPIVHDPPQVYIPSGQYIQSSHPSSLTQMQAIGDSYGELTYYNLTGSTGDIQPASVHQVLEIHPQPPQPIETYDSYPVSQAQAEVMQPVHESEPMEPLEANVEPPQSYHQTVVFQHSNQSHQTFPLQHTVHSQELTETESIAMDIMGLFNESTVQGTETPIEHL
eukprot:maker-scaffold250_size238258-snap-gene-1.18 protein:Tk02989 transcript:maker-scaffold250_size238258-snap-gene-1.18-mRNA-1 annotation:"zinc finger protein 883-like"